MYPAIPVQVIPNVFEGKPDEMIPVQFGTKYNASAGIQLSQLLFNQSYFVGLKAAKSSEDLYRLRKTMTEEIEVKLRNQKKEAVTVMVKENLYRWTNWQITGKTHDYRKDDARTVTFPVKIATGAEAVVRYSVTYTW